MTVLLLRQNALRLPKWKDKGSISGGRGYFGWPKAATAETGEKLVAIRGRNIALVILKAWGKP